MKKQLLFSFLIILSFATYSQERPLWEYPIKPKTEEWKKLESNKAKVEACQVPEQILRDISTNDLMTLCLQYPLLYDVFAFNEINDGLRKLFSDFHSNTSKENQKKILENLLFGYREKIKYPEYFQGNGFATNLFARAHIIIKIDTALSEKFEKENKAVLFSGMANADTINLIDSLSYNLIK